MSSSDGNKGGVKKVKPCWGMGTNFIWENREATTYMNKRLMGAMSKCSPAQKGSLLVGAFLMSVQARKTDILFREVGRSIGTAAALGQLYVLVCQEAKAGRKFGDDIADRLRTSLMLELGSKAVFDWIECVSDIAPALLCARQRATKVEMCKELGLPLDFELDLGIAVAETREILATFMEGLCRYPIPKSQVDKPHVVLQKNGQARMTELMKRPTSMFDEGQFDKVVGACLVALKDEKLHKQAGGTYELLLQGLKLDSEDEVSVGFRSVVDKTEKVDEGKVMEGVQIIADTLVMSNADGGGPLFKVVSGVVSTVNSAFEYGQMVEKLTEELGNRPKLAVPLLWLLDSENGKSGKELVAVIKCLAAKPDAKDEDVLSGNYMDFDVDGGGAESDGDKN